MKQPDFILGGATRGGIKTLAQILDHHPQIHIPKRKEHRFFHQNNLLNAPPGAINTPFEDASDIDNKVQIPQNRILHGEMEYDPKRAHQGCPHAKIIFTLSDPVERAYDQFQHALRNNKEVVRTFEQAMNAELQGLRTPETGRCWIYKNQYQTHIEEWFKLYPKNKLCVVIYEEWSDPEQRGFRRLEDFLGLQRDTLSLIHDDGFDARKTFLGRLKRRKENYPPMDEDVRTHMEEILSLDKKYIENLVGRPIPAWQRKF